MSSKSKIKKLLPDEYFNKGVRSPAMKILAEEFRDEKHFEFFRYINEHDNVERVVQKFGELFVINLTVGQIRKLVESMTFTFEILANLNLMSDAREVTKSDPYTRNKDLLYFFLQAMKVERRMIYRLYNICNDQRFLPKTYSVDVTKLILPEEQTTQNSKERFSKPEMGFDLYMSLKERDYLILLLRQKNEELHDIICKMRRIVLDINVMMGSRPDENCEMCRVKPNYYGKRCKVKRGHIAAKNSPRDAELLKAYRNGKFSNRLRLFHL